MYRAAKVAKSGAGQRLWCRCVSRSQMNFGHGRLLATLLVACFAQLAQAQTDFERGFIEGYGKGYQDGIAAGQPGAARSPYTGPPGIVVVRAWYGDGNKSCDLTAWAAARFNRRTNSEIDVTNKICGDPAPGQRKTLRVDFLCNGQTKTAEAPEHRRLSLFCY